MHQKNLFRCNHLRRGGRPEREESGIWPESLGEENGQFRIPPLSESKPLAAAGDQGLTK